MKTKRTEFKTYELCLQVARDIHAHQLRTRGEDKGKPYIVHPERVEQAVMPICWPKGDYGAACVAILHDCIEDYDYDKLPDAWTKDSILLAESYLLMRGVPKDIVKDVERLSKRDGESYLDFILRINKSKRATRVKIADIEDNLKLLEEGQLKQKYLLALHILKQK